LQQADFGTESRYAVVILKATYKREPDGSLLADDDPMPIVPDPLETPYGMLNGDLFLRKQGADLCVLGTLRRSRMIKEATISIVCGGFRHALRVYGDRAWVPTGARETLVPSAPIPFNEMQLTYAHAYGGVASAEGLKAAHPDNPIGRGYYLSREEAVGKLLPNIESGSAPPIRTWNEQPAPAGWAPYFMSWGLRARGAVAYDPKDGTILNVAPSVFNNAHPELVLPQIDPGQTVAIEGARDTAWKFNLPSTRGRVRVDLGPDSFDVTSHIDGVFAWMDSERVVVTQRANFKYVVHPGQRRGATLTTIEN
jgi:hypothetical protein